MATAIGFVIATLIPVHLAQAFVCDNAQFFEQCPTADPQFAKFAGDFKIRKDGVLFDPNTLTCMQPISALPIAQYSDELVLMQALRAIYYMDLGRSNHLPWTSKALYDWLKDGVGGFNISKTDTYDHYVGPVFAGDTANYFVIRAKDDFTRDFQRKWAGPAGISTLITLMMHERRHADGAAYNHVRCCPAQDPSNPNSACDQTYSESATLSPYGIQYWLEKNWISGAINAGVGCMAPTAKADAIYYMRQDVNSRVNPTTSNFCSGTPPVLDDVTNPPGACGNCSGVAGGSSGEPHIATFDGLYYDFQAAGEFLLTTSGPSFVVQVRQQWTPNRPDVAFNKAAAMLMGKTRVAFFLDPSRLVVNGKPVDLADGKTLSLPDGIEVVRYANVYSIRHGAAETVRITAIDNEWVKILGGHFLDISVSLHYAAAGSTRGLLGDGNGTPEDDIATRDGQPLKQPVSFDDFYRRYGASLVIKPDESLFGEDERPNPVRIAFEPPKKPFTVANLTQEERRFAQSACTRAGVRAGPLLDACTLDVAVLRSPDIAKLFAAAAAPAAVMKPNDGIQILPGGKCPVGCTGGQIRDARR